MARPEIIIICILAVVVVFVLVRAWRRSRDDRKRRARWPALDFSKVTNEPQVPSASPDGWPGFSTSFDSVTVRPFLERIQPLIEAGFGPAEIEQVGQVVATLAPDQEQALEFQIRHAGSNARFQIRVVMGDIEAPDLYFFSPPALTRQIGSEFMRFAKERE